MDHKYVLFFDGECVLCNGIVKWLFERDPDRNLYFASLQGETAAALRSAQSEFPEGLDTIVFWDDGVLRVRSAAALWVSRLLCAPWRWARLLRFIPGALTDPFYRLVARNRIRWFGKTETCWLPSPDQRARFLP